jgi:hypothetical protein
MDWLKKIGLGKVKAPNLADERSAQDIALEEYLAAGEEYNNTAPTEYSWLGDLVAPEALGDTGLADIETNPLYAQYEQQALADLEQQSRDGLSARDKADMARLEADVNRQNAGRLGAIKQGMNARGMGGSGMDLVAQQQAAQAATEREAIASLEKAAQVQDGRRDATSRLGALSSQLQGRDYQQQANAASAQDRINQFNVGNRNQAAQYNHAGRQGAADGNVGVQNGYRQNVLNNKKDSAQMGYNSATERLNQKQLEHAQKRKAKSGQFGAILGAAGGIAGGVMGSAAGPMGTAMGASVGASLGGSVGNSVGEAYYSHGGKVPGQAPVPGDHPANDTQKANLSPGEIVIPRSIANDPNAAKKFVEQTNEQDAVAGLLKALEHMTKKKKG